MSTSFEFLCILLYAFVFPKLPIVKSFRKKAASEGSKTVAADLAAAGEDQGVLLLYSVFKFFYNILILMPDS